MTLLQGVALVWADFILPLFLNFEAHQVRNSLSH